ncbi:MAG TPA: deoxyribose-phosphate aldolase [Clostridiaceae bacterium]|nr:deoxyribose-phosphate aldolase [Clostridiaceae bacterium]
MDINEVLTYVDHTLLKPTATRKDIRQLIDDAVRYNCASVCLPPSYVSEAVNYAQDRIPICTVIGFPNGYNTTAVKVFEAQEAIDEGAAEIDMVVNLGWVKDGLFESVQDEIEQLRMVSKGRILKVIIESSDLTEQEKVELCKVVTAAGADFIKTSTGFAKGGATFADVALMREICGREIKIKAAGGISSLEDAKKFIELGADRLGTSRLVKIAKTQEV